MYITPAKIVVDFLRCLLKDPRGRGETINSNTFTTVLNQTDFQLTANSPNKVQCVTLVTVAGTPQKKWKDYYIDTRRQMVVFFTGLTSGQEVLINFKEGKKSWIFEKKTNKNKTKGKTAGLKADDYPRIIVTNQGGTDARLGRFNCEVESNILFQIDCWAKEKENTQLFTIDGLKYGGNNLSEYLIWNVKKCFETNEEDLHPVLYDYQATSLPKELSFDESTQSYHYNLDIILKGLNVGRI